jgi:hypothetical protein
MNCKTGCGNAESAERAPLCEDCAAVWDVSPERQRVAGIASETPGGRRGNGHRCMVAVVDFCNRVRAERQNTKSEGTT